MLEYRKSKTVIEENALTGVAVPYNQYAEIRDSSLVFRERFLPGSVEVPDTVTLRMGHADQGVPLARVGAGTVTFYESEYGLMFRAKLPESRFEVREALKRGDLDGSVSIGFYATKDIKKATRGGRVAFTRTVTAARLDHLAIVEQGAYENAKATLGND
tara:strand:- start:815 stop:1291 length:477 start_codon:yes stop_codon:yes gene_type:complete